MLSKASKAVSLKGCITARTGRDPEGGDLPAIWNSLEPPIRKRKGGPGPGSLLCLLALECHWPTISTLLNPVWGLMPLFAKPFRVYSNGCLKRKNLLFWNHCLFSREEANFLVSVEGDPCKIPGGEGEPRSLVAMSVCWALLGWVCLWYLLSQAFWILSRRHSLQVCE